MIKDQEKESLILEMLNTAIEASEQMHAYLSQGKEALFRQIHQDLYHMMVSIEGIADKLKEEESGLTLPAAVASIKFTLQRIFFLQAQTDGRLYIR